MIKRWMAVAAPFAVVLPLITGADAADSAQAKIKSLSGEVRRIDGRSYVIRDRAGNDRTLTVDETTKVEGVINMGDQVVAEVENNGRVKMLKARSPKSDDAITKTPMRERP